MIRDGIDLGDKNGKASFFVNSVQDELKFESTKIPISEVIPLELEPPKMDNPIGGNFNWANGLVVDKTFTKSDEPCLFYIESGSQHGVLRLINFTQPYENILRKPNFPELEFLTSYDRNQNRRICNIYIPGKDYEKYGFRGTMTDFLSIPGIRKRKH